MKNEYGAECYAPQMFEGRKVLGFDEVDLPFYGRVSLANATEYKVGMFLVSYGPQSGRLFVGIEGASCYTFSAKTHPSYVQEKLNLFESDAKSMADFICGQFDKHPQFQDDIQERFI